MIEYLIESTLCFAIFYVGFDVFFKNTTNYKANRSILLLALVFSVLVPLLAIPLDTSSISDIDPKNQVMEVLSVSSYLPAENTLALPTVNQDFISMPLLLISIYFIVSFALLIRFGWHLKTLLLKQYRSEKVNYNGHTLSLIEENVPPFTFFQSIFINKTDFKSGKFKKELIIHEIAHKHQWHSIDIVFIELLQIVFWFNPFVYLFKQRIKINHEYLADRFVLLCGTRSAEYADQLLQYTFPHKVAGFASAFNNPLTIKNRLIMISKFQEKRPKAYRLLLLIPIAVFLFVSTAFNKVHFFEYPQWIQTENDRLLESPGTVYADYLFWSKADNELYLKGTNVRIKHGENDFVLNGRASYLGKVHYFVFNNEPASYDNTINVSGKKCIVVKLSPENAQKKYGSKGKLGAVEITTVSK